MRHFVHGPDGQKYGPADLTTLQQWRNEGRLTADTYLEPEVGGGPFPAKNLPGLFLPETSQTDFAAYPYSQPVGQNAQSFVIGAWVMGVVALCFCPIVLGPASIFCAFKAKSLGHPQGPVLVVYSIVMTIIALVAGVAGAVALMSNFPRV